MTTKQLDEIQSPYAHRSRVNNDRLPPAYEAAHEARILAHQERVEHDLIRLGLIEIDEDE